MNRLLLSAWKTGDVLYRKCRKFDFDDSKGDNIFRIIVNNYHGPDLQVRGTWLRNGDRIGELHLYNYRLQKILANATFETQLGLVALREVRKSFPSLIDFMNLSPKGQSIQALVGITVLHKGAASLGFDVFDLDESWYKHFKAFYMRWMMRVCHPYGSERFNSRGESLIPKRVVMMRDSFLSKYGHKAICVTN
ncbi:YkoP family protein [Effusibacillus lacus]|uniref:YkoP family protein n=1 Tax=Effusibacillus lacus TaxID=1348429 RepID=UPI000BB7578A|nr:hypothetical protein [Effusibacillus lacus]TCS73197.1 hypothetical protein EDD64_11976 [Effusibacillus lacus]